MPNLDDHLKINRCPHCSVDNPNLIKVTEFATTADNGQNGRKWKVYKCVRCGGVVTAFAFQGYNDVSKIYPGVQSVDENLPHKVKAFLQQAIDSTFAPAGSVMLCASSVDAMLKEKGYTTGSLYSRINKAEKDGLLTSDMATWAHEVRLDANDNRHSDVGAELPTIDDAKNAIEFTQTLSEFLFVLPSKVKRGIDEATKS